GPPLREDAAIHERHGARTRHHPRGRDPFVREEQLIMAKTASKTTKPKAVAKKVVDLITTTTIEPAELKSFGKGDADHPGFSFTRYWWEGEGPREGITPWVQKKLNPGDDPVFGKAAKAEALLPDTAPSPYLDPDFL